MKFQILFKIFLTETKFINSSSIMNLFLISNFRNITLNLLIIFIEKLYQNINTYIFYKKRNKT